MTETTNLTLAEQAKANYEKVSAECKAEIPDIYDELVAIIKDVSSKGAIGLNLYVSSEPADYHIELDEPEYYLNVMPHVYISMDANKGIEQLVERLRKDGFTVKTYNHSLCGEAIDTITWVSNIA